MEKAGTRERDAILCVCLNPVIQKTLVLDRLEKDAVNRSREHRVDASGKGVNVARVLSETGRRAIHLTQAGGPTRDWFMAMCEADGIDLRAVDSGSEIRFCHTVIDSGDGTATELVEEASPVRPGTAELVMEAFERALPECRALVVSGTRAPGFPDGIFPEMARRARDAGLLVVLDIKGKDLLACLPTGPRVVKPNLAELLSTWPETSGTGSGGVPDEGSIRDRVGSIARDLLSRYGTSLVVTRGSKPTWYEEGGGMAECPVDARKQLNPTGSGDAFTAGLVAGLLETGSLADAIREGTRLGGLNAERLKPGSVR